MYKMSVLLFALFIALAGAFGVAAADRKADRATALPAGFVGTVVYTGEYEMTKYKPAWSGGGLTKSGDPGVGTSTYTLNISGKQISGEVVHKDTTFTQQDYFSGFKEDDKCRITSSRSGAEFSFICTRTELKGNYEVAPKTSYGPTFRGKFKGRTTQLTEDVKAGIELARQEAALGATKAKYQGPPITAEMRRAEAKLAPSLLAQYRAYGQASPFELPPTHWRKYPENCRVSEVLSDTYVRIHCDTYDGLTDYGAYCCGNDRTGYTTDRPAKWSMLRLFAATDVYVPPALASLHTPDELTAAAESVIAYRGDYKAAERYLAKAVEMNHFWAMMRLAQHYSWGPQSMGVSPKVGQARAQGLVKRGRAIAAATRDVSMNAYLRDFWPLEGQVTKADVVNMVGEVILGQMLADRAFDRCAMGVVRGKTGAARADLDSAIQNACK